MEIESKESEVEYKPEIDEKGYVVLKRKDKIKKGKVSRGAGARFELKVRKDLEEKGWVVDKWSNNFNLESGEVVTAKRKFNPFSKVMTIGTGFPDFVAFQLVGDYYNVVGVEVKVNGVLSKVEKEKCVEMINRKIFNDIWIAKKKKEGRNVVVEYIDFKERYKKLFYDRDTSCE